MSLPKRLLMLLFLIAINTNSWADRFSGGGFSFIGETEKTLKGTYKPRVRIKNTYSLVFVVISKEYGSKREALKVANKEARRRANEARDNNDNNIKKI